MTIHLAPPGVAVKIPATMSTQIAESVSGRRDLGNHLYYGDNLTVLRDSIASEPSRPMITEAAGAGQYEVPGRAGSVPRLQIVTIAEALALRDRAVRLPVLRQDSFKKAAREEDRGAQGALDL